jgi:diaminohydroxyphosphoribosylaminopyrimidine deaminase/5-amino-6-(5-phosphoribosylamino)uracil reductase
MTFNPIQTTYERYMGRCLQLATLGSGYVAPNPLVGAVLVHEDRIIGEGFHKKYGEAHAEVNCLASVKEQDKYLISQSTLYVSLEPCVHHGKTPPCTDLIIKNKIPKVIIGSRDPFKLVDGKGIQKLQNADIEVGVNVLENECRELNKRFFTFYEQHRPYIILKWAQTGNSKIAGNDSNRLYITNEYTNRVVHRWRGEEAAILVGTNTAMLDNPELTNRLWPGPSPARVVIDMKLRLPLSHKIFDRQSKTIIINGKKHGEKESDVLYYQVTEDVNLVHQVVNALYNLRIQSVLVEGGARLLQSFIDEEMWDEARIITNEEIRIRDGLPAPELNLAQRINSQQFFSDKIEFFKRQT